MVYFFNMKMHIGLPSNAIVKEGDEVKRGQCIAEPEGLGARIHSSVTGKVIKVDKNVVEIEANEVQSSDYEKIKECSSIADYAYEAGIVGGGGAGFPTHIKLKTQVKDGYIIANCVECEPGLEHNIERIEKNSSLIVKGIKYAMESTGATKAYVGIKEKNTTAILKMEEMIKELGGNIEVAKVKNIYPMGEERALIHSILGEWIDAQELPSKLNCVVLNSETLANLTLAIEEGKPVIDKDFTVVGDFKNKKTSNVYFDLPIGYSIKELTKDYVLKYELGELVIGGPYTGTACELENAIITKTSGGAIFTLPLPEYKGPIGLLVCACGGDEARLRDIATKMGSEIKAVTFCKNISENKKCNTPGVCPGQAQGVMYLKAQGSKRILMSNCNDCSNTVMCCGPKLGVGVYHSTDHIFRTIDYPLSRRMDI